jgi:DNA polymerase III subunit beta
VHLNVIKSDLLRLLDLARTFSDRDPPKPILRNALLSVVEAGEHQLLRVTASDLLQTLTVHASCAASELGAVALSARALYDVVSTLPEGPVELREEETRVVVCAGRRIARIPFEAGDDFPAMPEPDAGVPPATISASTLVSLLQRVEKCASRDMTRPELSAVLLEIGDGEARAVALDGRAMAIARELYKGEHGRVAVVPIKAALRLLTALQKHEGQVLLSLAASSDPSAADMLFQFGAVQFATKRVDRDRYMPFEDVLALPRPHAMTLPTKALVDSCAAVRKVYDGDEFPKVTFRLSGGELAVSALSSSGRACSDAISGVDHEHPHEWAMSIDTLLDTLGPVTSETVELRYGDGTIPFAVVVPDNDSYTAVLSQCQL